MREKHFPLLILFAGQCSLSQSLVDPSQGFGNSKHWKLVKYKKRMCMSIIQLRLRLKLEGNLSIKCNRGTWASERTNFKVKTKHPLRTTKHRAVQYQTQSCTIASRKHGDLFCSHKPHWLWLPTYTLSEGVAKFWKEYHFPLLYIIRLIWSHAGSPKPVALPGCSNLSTDAWVTQEAAVMQFRPPS